jgi:hypothetical protein
MDAFRTWIEAQDYLVAIAMAGIRLSDFLSSQGVSSNEWEMISIDCTRHRYVNGKCRFEVKIQYTCPLS